MKTTISLLIVALMSSALFADDLIQTAWQKSNGGGGNWFYCTTVLPKGTKIKLKCVQQGEGNARITMCPGADDMLNPPYSGAFVGSPTKGSVHTWVLPANLRPAVSFLWVPSATSARRDEDVWVLTFEGGWVFHLKVYGEDF